MNWSGSGSRFIKSKIPNRQKIYHATLQKVKDKSYPVIYKYLLDSFTEEDIESKLKTKQKLEALIKAEWKYYHDQRQKKSISLGNAFRLSQEKNGLTFSGYYRCVFSKFQNTPLSSKGSILTTKGGRFNIGKLDGYETFPGFYIADSSITARSEAFQTDITKKMKYDIPSFALQTDGEASHSVARINGHLERVVNLNSELNLKRFVKVLKRIIPSEEISLLSKSLGLEPHGSVSTVKQLEDQLFERNPSYYPSNFELPHNSQDFGRLAKDAGIQALIYNSKYGNGKCLVIFPENLKDCKKSFLELSDEFPEGVITRLDYTNYNISYT